MLNAIYIYSMQLGSVPLAFRTSTCTANVRYHLQQCSFNTIDHMQFIRKTQVGSTHSRSIHSITLYTDSKHEALAINCEISVSSDISCQFSSDLEDWRESWSGFYTSLQGGLAILNQFGKCLSQGGLLMTATRLTIHF